MKNESYKVTINLHASEISSTQCNCPRGEYKCSHAAALAIYCIHNISRTDVQCEWKKQKGPDKTEPVEEIYPSPKEYICLKREVTDEDRAWLYGELKRYGNFTGTLWILSSEPEVNNQLPIPTVESIVTSEEFINYEGNQKAFLVERLKIDEYQRKTVTREQLVND